MSCSRPRSRRMHFRLETLRWEYSARTFVSIKVTTMVLFCFDFYQIQIYWSLQKLRGYLFSNFSQYEYVKTIINVSCGVISIYVCSRWPFKSKIEQSRARKKSNWLSNKEIYCQLSERRHIEAIASWEMS